MQSLNGISFTPYVNHWLANTRDPRVLHIFDNTCNLINEHRGVLSVVTPRVGNGPFNLVVEDDVLLSEHLDAAASISIHKDQLILGDLTINVAAVGLWNPRPDWERLHHHRGDVLKQLISLAITTPKPLLPDSLVSGLSFSFAIKDISSASSLTMKLAGLGAGLTPAGDDFLIGAMYAAWIIHPLAVASALAQEVANTAATRTTSLSAAWLRSAGNGEAGSLWHALFDALLSGNARMIDLQITKLLCVGHTSGANALAGFLGTLLCRAALNSKIFSFPS